MASADTIAMGGSQRVLPTTVSQQSLQCGSVAHPQATSSFDPTLPHSQQFQERFMMLPQHDTDHQQKQRDQRRRRP
jgi:hypothetical protein